MKFLNHIDLSKTEVRNAAIQVLGAAPSAPVVGQIYFDSVTGRNLSWNGTGWVAKATDSDLLGGQNSAFHVARANHTGTQPSSTISDLATTVKAYRLDEFALPTAAVSYNSQRITNLADPSSPQDAATRSFVLTQVESAAAGIDSKASVRAIATANIALTGAQTIDGVAITAGDRVLVTAQTAGADNGVYVAAAGAWTRALDADQSSEITPGAFWFVEEGTAYGKSQWRCNNTGTITLGTTVIVIVQFGAAQMYTASLGVQLVGTDFRAKTVTGGGIQAVSGGLQVDTAVVARKHSATVGDGVATSIAVTHNLGTSDVTVALRDATSNAVVYTNYVVTDTNTVTFSFANAPASNSVRATIIG